MGLKDLSYREDNSKYHYLNNKVASKVFILKDKEAVKISKSKGYNSVYCYSLHGLWAQLTADHVYWSHGMQDFVPCLIAGSKVIGLQHGAPIKKGGKARESHYMRHSGSKFKIIKMKVRHFFYKIAPYMNNQHCNFTICGEHKFNQHVQEVFEYSRPVVLDEMLPRIAYAPKREKAQAILLAPTYRNYRSLDETLKNINFDQYKINELLIKNNFVLLVRPHPMDSDSLIVQSLMKKEMSHIHLDQSEDLYDQITKYDLIITDFSSIYQDAVWLKIPSIAICDDLDKYHQKFGLFDWFFEEIKNNKSQDILKSLQDFFARGVS